MRYCSTGPTTLQSWRLELSKGANMQSKRQLYNFFAAVIWSISTLLIPNCCFSYPLRPAAPQFKNWTVKGVLGIQPSWMFCAVGYFDANVLELDLHWAEHEKPLSSLWLWLCMFVLFCRRSLNNWRHGNHSCDQGIKKAVEINYVSFLFTKTA